jgi:hypothetical protein
MAVREADYHYLRTNVVRAEPRRFPSLTEAMAAMDDLLRLQKERGFDHRKGRRGETHQPTLRRQDRSVLGRERTRRHS